MKQLTSTNNPIIKQLKNLQQKKHRKEENAFLIEGVRLVNDAIENGIIPETLLIHQDKIDRFSNIITCCQDKADIFIVSDAIIQALSLTEAPEGIVAKVKTASMCKNDDFNNHPALVLDGVQDPGNLGTIIRTANAAGIKDIYLLGANVDVYNPKVVRSAMGAIFFVNFHFYSDATELYSHLRSNGYVICVTTLSDSNYYTLDLPKKIALVMGNEGNGVSEQSLKNADHYLTLPMSERAESLNVAVCTGILIFDILYRR